MANWYTTREAVKTAARVNGVGVNAIIDNAIKGRSLEIDQVMRRFFIPRTETRYYEWPPRLAFARRSRATVLNLDQDLISITTLQTQAQDSSPTTISSSDYFLEPNNQGPPYDRVEINTSSTAALAAGDTSQRSLSVLGLWGYSNDTRAAGTVVSGLAGSSSATSMVVSDGSLVDVGSTLIIDSEQIFVTERSAAALDSVLIDGALAASLSEVSITVDSGHGIGDGETIMVDSEKMSVTSSTATVLTVTRAHDGTAVAAHSDDTAIQVFRTLTIVRGVNGTTAATHANSTAITVSVPPANISELCLAETLAMVAQHTSSWGRNVGTGEGSREFLGRNLGALRENARGLYQRYRSAAI